MINTWQCDEGWGHFFKAKRWCHSIFFGKSFSVLTLFLQGSVVKWWFAQRRFFCGFLQTLHNSKSCAVLVGPWKFLILPAPLSPSHLPTMYELRSLFFCTYHTITASTRCLSYFPHLTVHKPYTVTTLLVLPHLMWKIIEEDHTIKHIRNRAC